MITFHCACCGREEEYATEDLAKEHNWEKINNDWACRDCWDSCDDCGDSEWKTELTYIENLDKSVCRHCFDDNYRYCEHCEEYDYVDDTHLVEITDADTERFIRAETWCHDCAEEYASYNDGEDAYRYYITQPRRSEGMIRFNIEQLHNENCPDCGEQTESPYLCPKHLKEMARIKEREETELWVYDAQLRNYHDGNHNKFKTTKYRTKHEHPYLYYGIELELLFQGSYDRNNIVKDFVEATGGLFVAEYDRSVDDLGCGVEFISRPCSFIQWTSAEMYERLNKGFKAIEKYKPYKKQPDGCGLHVHMSKRFFEKNTEKKVKDIKSDIDWIFQVFQPEIEKISRRKYTQYCASKEFRLKEILQSNNRAFNIKLKKVELEKGGLTQSMGSGSTHHDAIIEAGNTIEIRTFKSTIDPVEILATIEFCRAIAHTARNTKSLNKMTLEEILSSKDSKYLFPYMAKQKVDLTKKFTNTLEVKL